MTEIAPGLTKATPPVVDRAAGAVLFYDGECGLCNAAVRLLLRIDRHGRLRFAPLQGPTAQAYLKAKGLPTDDFDSMIFVKDWARRDELPPQFRTNAALSAIHTIGGGWRILGALRIIPRPLRDTFYRLVARFRYRIFGPYRPSPLPRADWAARFLP